MPNKISSFSNPKIKQVVSLRQRKNREKDRLTIIEGQREINCALSAKVHVNECFVTKAFAGDSLVKKLILQKTPVYEISEALFSKIAYGDRHEGVLAVADIPSHKIMKKDSSTDQIYLVVENIEKPGNLGAILRSCDGAGVDGVIVCDSRTDIYNPNVIRASLGTVFTVALYQADNHTAFEFLQKNRLCVLAATPQADLLYTEVNMKRSFALVLGSEENGLSDFWLSRANQKIKIPMQRKTDSLNVSVSTAIILYEAIRQRNT